MRMKKARVAGSGQRPRTGEVLARYSKKGVDLRVDIIDETMILIEGRASTLRFLGELFLAAADDDSDCGTQFFPDGPGNALFSKASKLGFYIHRLPCLNHPETPTDKVNGV